MRAPGSEGTPRGIPDLSPGGALARAVSLLSGFLSGGLALLSAPIQGHVLLYTPCPVRCFLTGKDPKTTSEKARMSALEGGSSSPRRHPNTWQRAGQAPGAQGPSPGAPLPICRPSGGSAPLAVWGCQQGGAGLLALKEPSCEALVFLLEDTYHHETADSNDNAAGGVTG